MTRAKGKKLLPQTSHVKGTMAFRGVKLVRPECQVLVEQNFRDQAYQEYTTGPCQQAVKDNPAAKWTWFKTCTHGPEQFEDGTPVPENLRPYYEVVMHKVGKPVVEEGKVVGWKDDIDYKVVPRVRDVAWNERVGSGFMVRSAQQQGAKPLEDFDIAPFCEMKGCFSQGLTKFSNGEFCSEIHAKLVKATEIGEIMTLAWDQGAPRPVSAKRRQEQLAKIEV